MFRYWPLTKLMETGLQLMQIKVLVPTIARFGLSRVMF
jgi:hypothetical protein